MRASNGWRGSISTTPRLTLRIGGNVSWPSKKSAPSAVPDSPEKLLRELPRRKIADVLLHQGEVMRSYAEDPGAFFALRGVECWRQVLAWP
jgi:hypothetical protein